MEVHLECTSPRLKLPSAGKFIGCGCLGDFITEADFGGEGRAIFRSRHLLQIMGSGGLSQRRNVGEGKKPTKQDLIAASSKWCWVVFCRILILDYEVRLWRMDLLAGQSSALDFCHSFVASSVAVLMSTREDKAGLL